MLAKLSRELPIKDGLVYEPKWDGFRCIVFRDGDEVVLGSRNERPLTRYFPELLDPVRAMLPEETPASFVAFDLLALGDDDLRGTSFGERRAQLEKALKKAKPPIHLTP